MATEMTFKALPRLAGRVIIEICEAALLLFSLVMCIPAVPSNAELARPSLAGMWLPLAVFVAACLPSYWRKHLTGSALLLRTGAIALFYVAISQRFLLPW